jgi:hypothetical protein
MTDPMTVLHDQIGILGVALAWWAERDDTTAQSEVRQATTTAAAAIDALLARLYAARSALLTQIRQSDDAAAARGDAPLTRIRQHGIPREFARGHRGRAHRGPAARRLGHVVGATCAPGRQPGRNRTKIAHLPHMPMRVRTVSDGLQCPRYRVPQDAVAR